MDASPASLKDASGASSRSSKLQDKLLPKSLSGKRRWKRPSDGVSPRDSGESGDSSRNGFSGRSGIGSFSVRSGRNGLGGRSDHSAAGSDSALRPMDGSGDGDGDGDGDSSVVIDGDAADDTQSPARGRPSVRAGERTQSDDMLLPRLTTSVSDFPDAVDDTDSLVRASTDPFIDAPKFDTTDPALALTSSKTSLAPPALKSRRSSSPGARFRNVFKSKKSPAASIASTPNQSPERPPRADSDKTAAGSSTPSIVVDSSDTDAAAAPATPSPSHLPAQPDTERDRLRRLSRGQKIDTSSRPETPPTNDKAPPVIVNTPPTPTDPVLPPTALRSHTNTAAARSASSASAEFSTAHSPVHSSHPNASSPGTGHNSMIAQRRNRAGSTSLIPSKLSSFTLAPLTPTPEHAPSTPSASGGFFSSVLSAAQNATNSLSNSITNSSITTPWGSNSRRVASKDHQDDLDNDDDDNDWPSQQKDVEVESSLGASLGPSRSTESKEPAVNTLGMGDLSLSQLGIVTDQPLPRPSNGTSSASNSAVSAPNSAAMATANAAIAGSAVAAGSAASPTLHAQRIADVETRSRSESAPPDSTAFHTAPDGGLELSSDAGLTANGRPGSVSDVAAQDDRTPPTASVYGDRSDLAGPGQRTNSIRSAIERRRKRGSSAVSGGTIAAAIAAANASVAHPAAQGTMPKLTGFAVASKKRNRDFHNLFKSVPDDDYLIEDYSCALQREILAHGRLYVSEGHLCFSSNILGWVTTLVMSFDEIVSVEKRSTALVFKNGLMISTLHAKHIFASFASRDSTYDLIVKIWKLGHPSLQSSLNGVRIDETGGDKTEKIDTADELASGASRSASVSADEDSEEDSDVYDEDAEDDDLHDTTVFSDAGYGGAGGGAGNGGINDDALEPRARKISGSMAAGIGANGAVIDNKSRDALAGVYGGGSGGVGGGAAAMVAGASAAAAGGAGAANGAAGGQDFPGPATHAPTDCGDAGSHYDKFLVDELVPAPLGKVFSYMFGAASVTFMPRWLSNDQKCFDIQMADKRGLGAENRSRTFSYIKPLYASIGPKQTKCIVTEQVEVLDFDRAVHIVCSTQNPDVPSGNVFTVKTKYCLTWGEGGGTRVQMSCTTEWSGKSWLKVPIEKAANEGQAQYGRDLFAGLKEALLTRPRGASGGAGGKGGAAAAAAAASRGGRKGRKGKAGLLAAGGGAAGAGAGEAERAKPSKPSTKAGSWGLLEPVHGLLEPALDIVQPLLTGNVMYGLLVGLLVASWFGFGFRGRETGGSGAVGVGGGGLGGSVAYPDRIAAYDEMWLREESALWDWLEERVGIDRLMDGSLGGVGSTDGAADANHWRHDGRASSRPQAPIKSPPRFTVEEKLRDKHMDDREIREAIRVTEEKLRVLKEVVDERAKGGATQP